MLINPRIRWRVELNFFGTRVVTTYRNRQGRIKELDFVELSEDFAENLPAYGTKKGAKFSVTEHFLFHRGIKLRTPSLPCAVHRFNGECYYYPLELLMPVPHRSQYAPPLCGMKVMSSLKSRHFSKSRDYRRYKRASETGKLLILDSFHQLNSNNLLYKYLDTYRGAGTDSWRKRSSTRALPRDSSAGHWRKPLKASQPMGIDDGSWDTEELQLSGGKQQQSLNNVTATEEQMQQQQQPVDKEISSVAPNDDDLDDDDASSQRALAGSFEDMRISDGTVSFSKKLINVSILTKILKFFNTVDICWLVDSNICLVVDICWLVDSNICLVVKILKFFKAIDDFSWLLDSPQSKAAATAIEKGGAEELSWLLEEYEVSNHEFEILARQPLIATSSASGGSSTSSASTSSSEHATSSASGGSSTSSASTSSSEQQQQSIRGRRVALSPQGWDSCFKDYVD
jgi:hypothetical protein